MNPTPAGIMRHDARIDGAAHRLDELQRFLNRLNGREFGESFSKNRRLLESMDRWLLESMSPREINTSFEIQNRAGNKIGARSAL
jgi:hypothetical protein